MWKGFSKQIGHRGTIRSGVCGGGSLLRMTCSSRWSVGTFGILSANIVGCSVGNALDVAEGFLVLLLTGFRFAGSSGGIVSLALDK